MKDIWVPLSGAIGQQRNVETIANNVANANTPSFKRDQLVFKEYLTALDRGHHEIDLPEKEWAPKDFYRSYGAEHSMVKVDGSYIDMSQGQLVPTSAPLDVALFGKGFLEVLTPNGIRFTRKGNLTLTSQGILTTEEGHPILSAMKVSKENSANNATEQDNSKRFIKIPTGKITITYDGKIFAQGQELGKISIIEFKDPHALRKEGNSLFINPYPDNFLDKEQKTRLHQGFIEQSNVNAVKEISSLIQANRNFESIQKVIKTYDGIAGKEANDIARF